MIEILRKIFEANPGKNIIELIDKCSGFGNKVIIKLTRTSGGFGLDGGLLIKHRSDSYFAKCPDCGKLNRKMNETRLKIKPLAARGWRQSLRLLEVGGEGYTAIGYIRRRLEVKASNFRPQI